MESSPERMSRRRSERVPLSALLTVFSLDPWLAFTGRCNTVDVSCHGCRLVTSRPFLHNTKLRLNISFNNRTVTSHVVRSIPVLPAPLVGTWFVSVELDTPGDYWQVQSS